MQEVITTELALIIIMLILYMGGYEWLRDRMCNMGAAIYRITTVPIRRYEKRKAIKEIERQWQKYIDENRARMIQKLMQKQQEQFTGRYTTDELGKGLQEFALSMREQEEKQWQEHIMARFTRKM